MNSKHLNRTQAARWLDECIEGETGKPLPVLANAVIALQAEWPQAFAYDEILRAPVLMKALDGANDFRPRPVTDVDVGFIQERLQHLGLKRAAKDTVHQAVALAAHKHRFHPVIEYLDNLKWDGSERAVRLFTEYFGSTSDPTYAAAIGKMLLIALVARIFEPGCKADYMPVIEGPQGTFKSTALRILGGEWFSDSLPNVAAGKDASQYLRGKWLIEVAEMHAMSRAEESLLKAFITRQEERYRPSYGRLEVIEPRQCLFIGTTNKEAYLHDETGGRRFWPVRAGNINLALARDRDQLFAEAIHLYRAGEQWWPDRDFEREFIVREQQSRYEGDTAWEEVIQSYLTAKMNGRRWEGGRSYSSVQSLYADIEVTIGEIATEALKIEKNAIGTNVQRRIAKCLTALGWRRKQKNWKGQRVWEKVT